MSVSADSHDRIEDNWSVQELFLICLYGMAVVRYDCVKSHVLGEHACRVT